MAETLHWQEALQQVFAEPWRVRPAYQPIIDLERGTVWACQVLARFISPLRATPPEWLEAAGALGLRQAPELRLLQAGLDAMPELPERCRLVLPMTPETLASAAVQKVLVKQVPSCATSCSTSRPAAPRSTWTSCRRRRSRCAAIALLAGASPEGLDALPRLRPDVLKLGVDYVAGVDGDPRRHVVVEGLAQVVGTLGGRLLGVGIETQAQLDVLTSAGISLGQGFGLGRPVPSMAASVTRAGAPLLNR